jgi:adenosylcobinamide-phosphate synthase
MPVAVWVVSLAVMLDLTLGEPASRWHPVVWIGNLLKFARSRWRAAEPRAQFLEGTGWWLIGASLVTGIAWFASSVTARLPIWLEIVSLAILLKPLLSIRSLWRAVRAVQVPLAHANLPEARKMLSWHLVSRDTSQLLEDEIAGAAIESLFENLSDSVIAPLLCFLIGGLPFAALYRFANTGDAMWGYRTPPLEYAGKFAARADDLLNLIPSRVTGACLALGSLNSESWRVMWRDGSRTASPNAGVPMAAGAGALGIRLEKRGVYALNRHARAPEAGDMTRAIRLSQIALIVFLGAMFLLGVLL